MSLTSNRDDSKTSKATTKPAQGPRIHSCIDCRHYRLRPKAELFGPSELQTPGGLKAYNEWQQQEKQHAEREAQLVASGGIFTYEPHHYAWCAAFTPVDLVTKANTGDQAGLEDLLQTGSAIINPVTGQVSPIYALCLRMNARGDCQKHEHN